MREDFFLEEETEEAKSRTLQNLKKEKAALKQEIAKIQKKLDEEEERNFRINKRFFKINNVKEYLNFQKTSPIIPCKEIRRKRARSSRNQ